MTPEKQFENTIIRHLKVEGAFAHHFDAIGCDGWPDILVLRNNEAMLLECKYGTTDLRDDQHAFHTILRTRYRFDKIYTISKMPKQAEGLHTGLLRYNYIMIDSCFRSQKYVFPDIPALVTALLKEVDHGG